MSQEEKVGQLFIIGFDGTEMDDDLRALVQDTGVGGVILFARNIASPEQVAQLVHDLQTAAHEGGHPALFIAIDQEGGRVARLTEKTGFTEFPGAMAIAATGEVENARRVGSAMAAEMRAVGINVDFAPDLDVNNNPDNPVIGLRSFGQDPEQVARYGVAFLEGLQAGGVLAFGKHFPGHGDTATDSHLSLPVVPHDRERLRQVEFVPFRAAIQAGVAGIMSAHVTFPAIEPAGLPSTLSSFVMTDLLRGEMGYTGLLATDSLEMGALGEFGFNAEQAAAQAFMAGADLLLFNRDHSLHRAAYARILEQIRSGKISPERLDASVSRILAVKEKYGLLEERPPDILPVDTSAWPDHQALALEVALASVTLVRDTQRALPLTDEAPLLVIEVPGAAGLGELAQAQTLRVGEKPTQAEINEAMRLAKLAGTTLIATTDAKTNPDQARLVNALLEQGGVYMVVAMRNPYDLMAFPTAPTYLATYGYNPPMLAALVEVLFGRAQAVGRLPVELPEP
jgi:beta-N-acetylhexosaminidase